MVLWVKDAKRKKLIYNSFDHITVSNQPIKTIQANDSFTYLGAAFSTTSLKKINTEEFREDLKILRTAPCKPQQKLSMLVHFLFPKYYHAFIFSRLSAGALNKLDVLIRKMIRTTLHLPHDLPKAVFHAKVADGGLGVPAYRFIIPLIAKNRLVHRKLYEGLLSVDNKHINSTNQINNYFKKKLYASCDGAGLRYSSVCSVAHNWVLDGTAFLTGRD